MTRAHRAPVSRGWLAVGAGLIALAGASLWLHAGSVERANRLFRAGEIAEAAELYRANAGPEPIGATGYNLGTALLVLAGDDAIDHLRRMTADPDPAVAHRANYNVGYFFLTAVRPDLAADSALALLDQAVESNRAALRLESTDLDARWNLALAQRMVDSLNVHREDPRFRNRPGDDETRIDLVAIARSGEGTGESGREPDNPRSAETIGERRGAADGAREAWTMQDPGPMSAQGAVRLIGALADDPERLVRGILWSQRPDVAWWSAEAYPGGDW